MESKISVLMKFQCNDLLEFLWLSGSQIMMLFLLDDWMQELKLWCPALKVLVYYGGQEERRDVRKKMNNINILVTSYVLISTLSSLFESTE